MTARLTPACVWHASDHLVVALHSRFGEPMDCYVNGSQVWLRDDGPDGLTIEWRLHPVAGYRKPDALGLYEVFSDVALALEAEAAPPVAVRDLWGGLEAFPAHGDEIEPAPLAAIVMAAIGIPPDAVGLVDHRAVGDAWERTAGRVSIVDTLFDHLEVHA